MLLFLFAVKIATPQNVDFYGKKIDLNHICNSLGFKDNEEAKSYLDKVCDAADVVNNYSMKECPNIGTCKSLIYQGYPVILYDNDFLNKIKTLGFSERKITDNNTNADDTVNWVALTVLAHELGHLVNQHFSPERILQKYKHQNELEADEFAGKTMYKLGATLEQVEQAYVECNDKATIDYPSKAERINAVEKGYNEARAKYGTAKVNNNYSSLITGNWVAGATGIRISFLDSGAGGYMYVNPNCGKFPAWNINNNTVNLILPNDSVSSYQIESLDEYELTWRNLRSNQVHTYTRTDISALEYYNEHKVVQPLKKKARLTN